MKTRPSKALVRVYLIATFLEFAAFAALAALAALDMLL